jgi:hypothetical protein
VRVRGQAALAKVVFLGVARLAQRYGSPESCWGGGVQLNSVILHKCDLKVGLEPTATAFLIPNPVAATTCLVGTMGQLASLTP